MTQYTITSWFIIKSWAPQWGHLAQTSWFLISNAEILCRWWWCLLFVLANLYLPPFPARISHTQLPLSPNMESTSSAKFRPETDAFIEISNLNQSLLHNQTPTSKFLVLSTRVKWVIREKQLIFSYPRVWNYFFAKIEFFSYPKGTFSYPQKLFHTLKKMKTFFIPLYKNFIP